MKDEEGISFKLFRRRFESGSNRIRIRNTDQNEEWRISTQNKIAGSKLNLTTQIDHRTELKSRKGALLQYYVYVQSVLWIRIHLMRIRIQVFFSMRIRIQAKMQHLSQEIF